MLLSVDTGTKTLIERTSFANMGNMGGFIYRLVFLVLTFGRRQCQANI
jgi:hypothetical protein